MRVLHGFWGIVAMVVSTFVAAVIFLTVGWPLLLLPRGRRERLGIWLCVLVALVALRLFVMPRLDLRGLEHIPFGRSYLLVSNHRSWTDILLLVATGRAMGVAKRQVLYMPFLAQVGYLGGTVFFERGQLRSRSRALRECVRQLDAGVPLHVYPEGTRTRTGRLRPKVHLRLVEACWERGVPVVPAALADTERAIPVGGWCLRPFQRMSLHYRPAVLPERYPDARSFALACWDEVKAGLRAIDPALAQEDAARGGGGAAGA